VKDGAQISAAIFGNGNAGNLTVTATNIELVGTSIDGQFPSSITTVSLGKESGNSGTVTLDTQRLFVQDGAQISTATFGPGNAGNLTVTARDIELVGISERGLPSGITASVGLGLPGNQAVGGGTLPIDFQRFSAQDGTLRILATIFGLENAGNLQAILTNSGGVSPPRDSEAIGKGGTLTVNTQRLSLQDRAQISVSAFGQGSAGNLEIRSPVILLDNQAALSAETSAGDSGNITLNSEEILLRRNSSITTNATGEATGGSITMNTNRLIAIENSDITANAQQAFGGQISINANAVLGTRIRQQPTAASDITASSQLGTQFSGTIDFNSEFDSSGFAVEFTQDVIDPEAIIAQNPCRQNQESQFIITGRGGLPPNPTQETINPAVSVGLSDQIPEAAETQINQNQRQQSPRKTAEEPISSLDIVPARGWIRTENGDVILVGYDPTGTQVQRSNSQSKTCDYSILGEREK
jgi:large exoprotein involved in heme utilization and adhesion